MIIIGKMYCGNTTSVDGRVISGNVCDDSIYKKFDETKKESANGVNSITIHSNINVKVFTCNTTDVTAHLHGSAIMDNDLKLSVTKFGDEIEVSCKSKKTSGNNMTIISGKSVVINNLNCGNSSVLTLDITIPNKVFEKLSVKSKHAKINLTSSVNAKAITVENKHSNVNVSATFQNLSIECEHGKVNVDSEAHSDVKLNVTSKNGNVDVSIRNIGTSYVSVNSKNGSCKNNPKLRGTYTVSGNIKSKNGNAKFH